MATELLLISRSYCHLCHDMEEALLPLLEEFGVAVIWTVAVIWITIAVIWTAIAVIGRTEWTSNGILVTIAIHDIFSCI